ncbi:MAG TPA: hypothetical protein VHE13_06755 [Opitutus sp.]|nr:hypothetical protein [Opitutus sp.]
MTTESPQPKIEDAADPARIRLRDLRPEAQCLLFSMWGMRGSLRDVWRGNEESRSPLRVMKLLVCAALQFRPLGHGLRRAMWRRIGPEIEEVNFGSNHCLLREADRPGHVFKLDINSCLHNAAGQRERLARLVADYATLRRLLGACLEATEFEQRAVGSRRPLLVTGGVQRIVPGRVLDPGRASGGRALRAEPDLLRQWREICAAGVIADREHGLIPDVIGVGNILVEKPAGRPARLRIVDTMPLVWRESGPAWEQDVYKRSRSLLRAGAAD